MLQVSLRRCIATGIVAAAMVPASIMFPGESASALDCTGASGKAQPLQVSRTAPESARTVNVSGSITNCAAVAQTYKLDLKVVGPGGTVVYDSGLQQITLPAGASTPPLSQSQVIPTNSPTGVYKAIFQILEPSGVLRNTITTTFRVQP